LERVGWTGWVSDELLSALAQTEVPDLQRAAIRGLTHRGSAAHGGIEDLLRSMRTGAEDLRLECACAIMSSKAPLDAKEDARRVLEKALLSNDPCARASALAALLRRTDPPRRDELILRGAADADAQVRRVAVQAVTNLLEVSVTSLEHALQDPDESVRQRALWSMQRLGPCAGDAAPSMTERLGDPSPAVRTAAIRALGALDPAKEGVLPALVECLKDRDEQARAAALWGIVNSRRRAISAVPDVVRLLTDPAPMVRHVALTTLAWIGADPAAARSTRRSTRSCGYSAITMPACRANGTRAR